MNKIKLFISSSLLFYIFFILLYGCKNETINDPQAEWYEQRSYGNYSLTDEHVIIIRNFIGPVFIYGETTAHPSIRWFIDKKVEAEYEEKANEIFTLIQPAFQKNFDTLFVTLNSTLLIHMDAGIELDFPNSIVCIIEQTRGNAQIFYMDTLVSVRNAMNVELKQHTGSSDIILSAGNIFVETSLPREGFCRLRAGTGNIFISIPPGTSAEVYAKTLTGIVSYSGLTFMNIQAASGSLSGTLGSGTGEIRAEVNTGNIQLNVISN